MQKTAPQPKLSEVLAALKEAGIKVYGTIACSSLTDTSIKLTRSDVLSIQLTPYADTPFSLNHWDGEGMSFLPQKTIKDLIIGIKEYIK